MAMAAAVKVVVMGHVDDGKSTLIGRLLHETESLPENTKAQLKAISDSRHMPLEWSFLLDAFQVERNQAVTIDITRAQLKTKPAITLIDVPGHKDFIPKAMGGACDADAAIVIVDAAAGVRAQTRLHSYLLSLMAIKQVILVVNKMDTVHFNQERFQVVVDEMKQYWQQMEIIPLAAVPISARYGDQLITASPQLSWYQGKTLLDCLQQLSYKSKVAGPLRLWVQDVYKWDCDRYVIGQIASGELRVGDEILLWPKQTLTEVNSIECWPKKLTQAREGQAIGITVASECFVETGMLITHQEQAPKLTSVFAANIFWLDHVPCQRGDDLLLRLGTQWLPVKVENIEHVLDMVTVKAELINKLENYQCGRVILRSDILLPIDNSDAVVLLRQQKVVAGGVVDAKAYPDQRLHMHTILPEQQRVAHEVTLMERYQRNGHVGAVLWFTGLSAAGKSTLAMALEKSLFQQGYQVYALDSDNLPQRLSADLSFMLTERAEHLRRVSEIAALMARAGFIVITACISPYVSERDRAREIVGEHFHEIYINADLATCERRDPKGLYRKARAGMIENFIGIDAPYEWPVNPDLEINTILYSVDACIQQLEIYVSHTIPLTKPMLVNDGVKNKSEV